MMNFYKLYDKQAHELKDKVYNDYLDAEKDRQKWYFDNKEQGASEDYATFKNDIVICQFDENMKFIKEIY